MEAVPTPPRVVIIGGGIAGLYAAMKLCRTENVTLLEQDDTLGGRAKVAPFGGATVPTGAGIGRKAKDVRLQRLLRRLNIPAREFPVTHNAVFPCDDAQTTFQAIKAAYERGGGGGGDNGGGLNVHESFRTFATAVVGDDAYQALVACSGYSDYEDADVGDVLYKYGFEDNITNWTGFSVPWGDLIAAMADRVQRSCTVVTGCTVTRLGYSRAAMRYMVTTNHGVMYTPKVVIATDINTVRRLLPGEPMYDHVHGQPFIRVYATVNEVSAALLKQTISGVTIVHGPLQKVIAMSDTVYMVAYSDNASALYMLRHGTREDLARLLERSLGLPAGGLTLTAVASYYHDAGTHYNDGGLYMYDVSKLQRPMDNVFVVGEAVSEHQGWVEGALESVDAVL